MFLGVITAADNIKYPAINAFVRAFKQDQGDSHPQQGSLDDTELRNKHTGKLLTLEYKKRNLYMHFLSASVPTEIFCSKQNDLLFNGPKRTHIGPIWVQVGPVCIQWALRH